MICTDENARVSLELQYVINHNITLTDNVFRYGSALWASMIREARKLYQAGLLDDLVEEDFFTLESEVGELAEFEGRAVFLETFERDNTHEWMYVRGVDGTVTKVTSVTE